MDIDALVAAVEDECNRPDKTDMITRAVKAIVLKAHRLDYFPQDRVSGTFVPSPTGKIITVALPTRWRKFNIIAPLDTSGGTLKRKFHLRTPDNAMYFEGDNITERFHVAGSNVVCESYYTIENVGWTYYTYPDVTNGSDESWLQALYEQELIDGALAYVYKKLGDETTARGYRDLWSGNSRLGIDGHADRIIGDNLREDI